MPTGSRGRRAAVRSSLPISRAVLVTGGSRGIGRAICLEFARAGWQVGVHYRERHLEAERTAQLVKEHGGEGMSYQADIQDWPQVQSMLKQFIARCGRLDAMICNAGQAASGLVLRIRPEEWSSLIAVNLTGTFHCLKAAGQRMLAQRDGSVVVVASFAGLQGRPGQAAYAASKAGLLGLVRSAAREWGRYNVRVNAVLPGWHQTELAATAMPGKLDDHVLARPTDLDAVARTVFHLALLPDTSGQIWNVDSRIV